ncbi:hypothetical protein [Leeuwenhoekiella sp. MAR_2009_132]|uniref:hypothetical protein n=1 Tax=Leeuwenhoekiella sp. MAR_2009_132 TaxID=1392489 RepID=UPI00048D72EC|nr:hypothetical protein [Leeuwenhoekiella sp. MAR_2009_132]
MRYEKFKGNRLLTYLYFVIFLFIGLCVIVGGFLLGKFGFDNRVVSTVPLLIMTVGLPVLGLAFGTLNTHLNEFALAKRRKRDVDDVLKLYKIDYKMQVKFGREYHGTQDVHYDLEIVGRR